MPIIASFFLLLIALTVSVIAQAQQLKEETANSSQQYQQILREIDPHAVFVTTIFGENTLTFIVITPAEVKAIRRPIDRAAFDNKIASFRVALLNPEADPRPLAHELYDIVISPLESELKKNNSQTIVWSLDLRLRNIPIAALYDGEHYMVEKYRNVLFSLIEKKNLTVALDKIRSGRAFGVSDPMPGFSGLQFVPEELAGVAAEMKFGSSNRDVAVTNLINKEFTAEAFLKGIKGSQVVHIASHFKYDPGNKGQDSYLLLGDASHLTVKQIMNSGQTFSGVELLTLSACNSLMAGEDGISTDYFGTMLNRMGAKAVVASLWSVADESTSVLMRQFYHQWRLQDWQLKAEALREAQLSLLLGAKRLTATGDVRRDPVADDFVGNQSTPVKPFVPSPNAPFAHPYYWAPFVLYGNWR